LFPLKVRWGLSTVALVGAIAWGFFEGRSSTYLADERNVRAGSVVRSYVIDFAAGPEHDNLRYAPADERDAAEFFLDEPSAQQFSLLRFAARPVTLTAYSSLIEYVRGDLRLLNLYLSPDAVGYDESVRLVASFVKAADLADRFDVSGYEQHMGPVEGKEIWNPSLELEYVRVWPQLNCGWEWERTAREQLHNVRCRPFISVEPRTIDREPHRAQ
jgi:hypothetical protein